MAIKRIRLPDGQDVTIDEWLHWPLFSSIEFAAADALRLRAFSYIRGQRVPTSPNVVGGARIADDADTNMVTRTRMNHDEAFIVYAITKEVFALTDGNAPSPTGVVEAELPAVAGANLKRLDRDVLVELFIGAGIQKPQYRSPWSYIGQAIGSPAWTSGDTPAGVSIGTAGRITPANERRFQLPIYIENDRSMYMLLSSPAGAIGGLTQDLRIRMWLDGLKRRPIA